MIRAHLGETIDIHGGGLDLIFPHHENEIAQSRCAHGGAPLARFWVHNGFLDMGAEKMSKSLGNVVTVNDLLAQGHRGETLRLALLSAHYRSPLSWTEELVYREGSRLSRFYRAYEAVLSRGDWDKEEFPPHEAVVEALGDDLNTPAALSTLSSLFDLAFDLRPESAPVDDQPFLDALRRAIAAAKLLGFLQESPEVYFRGDASDPLGITARVEERARAKKNRDFATADQIRDELKAEGIVLEDGPSGTTWRRA